MLPVCHECLVEFGGSVQQGADACQPFIPSLLEMLPGRLVLAAAFAHLAVVPLLDFRQPLPALLVQCRPLLFELFLRLIEGVVSLLFELVEGFHSAVLDLLKRRVALSGDVGPGGLERFVGAPQFDVFLLDGTAQLGLDALQCGSAPLFQRRPSAGQRVLKSPAGLANLRLGLSPDDAFRQAGGDQTDRGGDRIRDLRGWEPRDLQAV